MPPRPRAASLIFSTVTLVQRAIHHLLQSSCYQVASHMCGTNNGGENLRGHVDCSSQVARLCPRPVVDVTRSSTASQ